MFYIPRKQRGRRSARAAQLSGELDLLSGSYNEPSFTWKISAARQRSRAQGLGREAENLYVLEPHPESGHPRNIPITASNPNVGSQTGS
jgi:hypothetical protein